MSTDWRAAKRAATRRAIQQHALALFTEKGYEATTVEEIAAAAGVSHMTFFRYFPQKEAVVEADDYDPLMARLLAARPAGEAPLVALHAALRQTYHHVLAVDRDAMAARVRLVMSTPALRSRLWVAQDSTLALFADGLAARAGLAEPDLAVSVHAAAALSASGAALTAWAAAPERDLVALLDAAFAALRAGFGG
ncbi:TetR family transcriptional regulator [Mycolicibacillus parakoreensis]|uniref:TetR family transcriptional regulator n=1 Tax=Mycolicibacillus parakoreensis TaxID=1069221 RepID=A0ABY3TWM7_9MYCO|nr:TetR family transcriptional regulator [Mycolicibacillus parakoreensis]MCV7317345.1 TetR family transcriptional regulator [Mycolicibacillus parakoreensis]ULN51617.1 TetR family transcriptional regulator [Mycolicibacillus parakoreensis]